MPSSVSKFLRLSSLALAAGLALPVHAQSGDPRPGFAEIFDPDRIVGAFVTAGLTALRTQMELEYTHLSTDIIRGNVALSGVTMRPFLPYDGARQCRITVDRLTISGNPITAALDVTTADANAIGVTASLACLEAEVGITLRQLGLTEIAVDRVGVDLEYLARTGELLADTTLALNGIGILDISAAGTLLPRPGPNGMDGDPALRLSRAILTVSDRGGWEAATAIIPEGLQDPLAVQQIGTQALTDLLSEGGSNTLGAAELGFIQDVMAEVARFVEDPGELTLEAQLPMGGLVVEPQAFDKPSRLIPLLALDARAAPSARAALLSADALAGLDAGDLDREETLALARALLSGDGVPRAPSRAVDLLDTLAGEGDPEALLLAAEALSDRDTALAYELALQASAADGVVSTLDALEAQMTTGDVMAAQAATTYDAAGLVAAMPEGDDPRDVRALALQQFTGVGAPRNYANAYLLALVAEAAGDVGAPSLLAEITGRFEARGDAVTTLWRETAAALEAVALSAWIDADLGSRFASP